MKFSLDDHLVCDNLNYNFPLYRLGRVLLVPLKTCFNELQLKHQKTKEEIPGSYGFLIVSISHNSKLVFIVEVFVSTPLRHWKKTKLRFHGGNACLIEGDFF